MKNQTSRENNVGTIRKDKGTVEMVGTESSMSKDKQVRNVEKMLRQCDQELLL